MRQRSEPRVATWFLKLFCSDSEYDAVTGDLLEQYQYGRGRVWFWRQVLDIVFLAVYCRIARRPLVPANQNRMPIGQGIFLFLMISSICALLYANLVLMLVFGWGIAGGIVAGLLLFARHTGSHPPPVVDDALGVHRGISMHHIPVEGAVGLLFVIGTCLIFALGIPAVRGILVVTVPLGVVGAAGLVYWHKRHPVKVETLGLDKDK